MNCRVLSVLGGVFVVVSSALNGAEEKPAGASPKGVTLKYADVRAILEAGQAADSLPPDVVLRVMARLSKAVPADDKARSEVEARGVDFNKTLDETWEFTSNHVHRLVYDSPQETGAEGVYRRVESLPFDSKNLCKDVLGAKVFAIADGQGSGQHHFAGTDYDIGHRAIEIFVDGKSALWVGESCLKAGFAESDAHAFAALYEKLAIQARAAFQAKPARSAPPKKNS